MTMRVNRRAFLKGSGAVVVGLGLTRLAAAAELRPRDHDGRAHLLVVRGPLSPEVDLGQGHLGHAPRRLLPRLLLLARLHQGRHRLPRGAGRPLPADRTGRAGHEPARLPEGLHASARSCTAPSASRTPCGAPANAAKGKWERITWDEALTDIADGMIDAIAEPRAGVDHPRVRHRRRRHGPRRDPQLAAHATARRHGARQQRPDVATSTSGCTRPSASSSSPAQSTTGTTPTSSCSGT